MKNRLGILLTITLLLTGLIACGGKQQIYKYNYIPTLSKNENGNIEKYYIAAETSMGYKNVAYSFSPISNAAKKYTELYNGSTVIKVLPVYGAYLEQTSLAVYMLYENEMLKGTKTLDTDGVIYEFDELIDLIKEESDSDSVSELKAVVPLSDKNCYDSLKICMEYCPDFKIEGFIYNDMFSYKGIYIVGHNADCEFVQYVDGAEINDFRMIDKCKTVEEAEAAFNDYFEKKNATISAIPVYSDVREEEMKIDSERSQEMFQNAKRYLTRAYLATESGRYFTLSQAMEYAVEIPLLNDNLQSGQYVMYLIYQHNNLIAEFVIDSKDAERVDVGQPLLEHISEVDKQTSLFNSLESGTYGSIVYNYAYRNNGETPTVVYFDGNSFQSN